jgi:ferredoxin
MPTLTVKDLGTFTVPANKRLVNALREEAGGDPLHACGGKARCTTCRVRFISPPPPQMTVAERDTRTARQIAEPEVRLSCQIVCATDMEVELISRFEGSGRKDPGSPVAEAIEPDPSWVDA